MTVLSERRPTEGRCSMPTVWTPPKVDWTTADGIMDSDLNRIECNTQFLYDQNQGQITSQANFIEGFYVRANGVGVGDAPYEVTVSGEGKTPRWSHTDGTSIDFPFVRSKVLSAADWVAGDGGEGKLQGATFTTDGWFWVYALYNPTTIEYDLAFDDNALGDNLGQAAAAGFTIARRLCPVRTSSLLTISGIIPMMFNTDTSVIRYAGDEAARRILPTFNAGVSTAVVLDDSLGNELLPLDSINGKDESNFTTIDIEGAVGTGKLTLWESLYFDTNFYSGVGQTNNIVGSGDVKSYGIQVVLGSIRGYAHTSNISPSMTIREMYYDTRRYT